VKILEEFGSPAVIEGQPVVGPTFIRYTLLAEKGISAKKILQQNLDLQVRLHLDAAPMIHVHEGRLVVDLQRKDRETILFSSIRQKLPLAGEDGNPKVPVGVDLDGTLHFADLSNPVNAHILVAGTAGSGKSEWLRSAIAGLLLTNTPRTLRLVLIDPKRNAFNDLKNSSFLYREDSIVYPPEHSAVKVLEALIEEMESRYLNFEKYHADDLQHYAQRSGDRKPRIVCVCDEYADLVSADKKVRKEIEKSISRLGAKARAAGIHLILATQRPSRDIVSGVLKANMSCKVGLRVQSLIESRLILEVQGAEKLLGYGDLLFCDVGDPVRLQSPFLPEQERNSIFRG
jgi:DNA segregation ATPase FtsK/SpoIIIE-like protein